MDGKVYAPESGLPSFSSQTLDFVGFFCACPLSRGSWEGRFAPKGWPQLSFLMFFKILKKEIYLNINITINMCYNVFNVVFNVLTFYFLFYGAFL